MSNYSIEFFDDNYDTPYIQVDGLEWRFITLDDGRDVLMLLPLEYTEVTKCNRQSRCTRWECVQCYESSFNSCDINRVRCWLNEESPRLIAKATAKKKKFRCSVCDHIFDAPINRVKAGAWCSYCSNRRLCDDLNCILCLEKSFAAHSRAKDWSDKNELAPRNVFKMSNEKFWINCQKCHHESYVILSHLSRSYGCGFCGGNNLCEDQECMFCFEKSFSSHPQSSIWSDKNLESPRDVCKKSNKSFLFYCRECNHEFESTLSNIRSDKYCPYCYQHKLCIDNNCVFCFEKSFSSNSKSNYWSSKNTISPRNVTKSSAQSFWFDCMSCGHDFRTSLDSIRGGSWCPYCKGQNLCDDLECIFCFEKSFSSQKRSKNWSKRNIVTPRQITKCSGQSFWFDCSGCGYEFIAAVNNVRAGKWCPNCRSSKLEKLCSEFLNQNNIVFEAEFSFEGHKSRYDFRLTNSNILIEADGEQHFTLVPHFHRATETETEEQVFRRKQRTDRDKDKLAEANGYYLIRIDYTLTDEQITNLLTYLLGLSDDASLLPPDCHQVGNIFYSNKQLYSYLI